MIKKLFFVFFISILLSACGTKYYYPLKNDTYFQEPSPKPLKVAVMPFNVNIHTNFTTTNTLEKRKEKSSDARKFVLNALKQELSETKYEIIDYISFDEVIEDTYDKEVRLIISELFKELNNANFSIQQNMENEKGKGFDYSVGIRAREMTGLFDNNPDVLVFLNVDALVRDLTAVESNAPNALLAVMTLGMSKLAPTPEDITSIKITLVDADTGGIIWVDLFAAYGRSILQQKDMHFMVNGLLINLFSYTLDENKLTDKK